MRTNSQGDSTLIIMPTYNELENAHLILAEILSRIPKVNILVIDDNSPDGTLQSLLEDFEGDSRCKFMSRERKLGLGSAYRLGFEFALKNNYKFVVTMDADGSHSIIDLVNILGVDGKEALVIGSRYVNGGGIENWNISRRFISTFGNYFARRMLCIQIRDCTSGFKRISVQQLAKIDFSSSNLDGYGFQIEITRAFLDKNFSVCETPIYLLDRKFGKSKMSWGIAFEAFMQVCKWKYQRNLSIK
jgi:dolichol-phosphate mannosyltransferase